MIKQLHIRSNISNTDCLITFINAIRRALLTSQDFGFTIQLVIQYIPTYKKLS